MSHLKNLKLNKRILLGITGGIAAYKTPELVRRLRDAGCDVRVVMTPAAKEFITPMTLQAVSGHPVSDTLFDPAAEAAMGHIELARWADLIVIAPATADAIARLTHGFANDLLTTLVLASKAPRLIAPAMNQAMWQDEATQTNVALLEQRGFHVMLPDSGSQACGDVGPGRLPEPAAILAAIQECFASEQLLGCHVVVTAGPTREAIDPVRYLSNHSSGKMGFALAAAAHEAGARVTLIAGPVSLPTPPGVDRVNVVSALDMHDAVMKCISSCDIFIGAAAVADYRPLKTANQKIARAAEPLHLELIPNPDIIAEVAAQTAAPFTVALAAQTEDIVSRAREKLIRKKVQMIAANRVGVEGLGFNSDDNAFTVIWREGLMELPVCSKSQLACQLMELISQHYHAKRGKL